MNKFLVLLTLSLVLSACSAGRSGPAAQQAKPNSSPVSGKTAGAQINAIRARANLPGLTRNAKLDAAARSHAADMVSNKFFAHKGSDGSTGGKRLTRAGYRWCSMAENISYGYSSQTAAIENWRKSPGHYRNIVSGKAQNYGIANVDDVWVMLVAAKGC